jgi:hypothetical protein
MGRIAEKGAAWWKDSRGAGFVEYVVLVGALALLAFGGYRLWASGVEHKTLAQAQTVRSLSSPSSPAGAADPGGGEASKATAGSVSDQPDDAARNAEVESVAAFDNSSSAETPGMPLSVIVMFVLGVLLLGGLVIATVARPRHTAADAESAEPSQ